MNNLLSFASVMKSVGGVLLAIVILLAMVTIHEFGHYLAGKILGFKINEFSVGFGPALFKKRSKKTGELFAVRVIPLGGYCAFDGEDEADEPEKPAPAQKQEPAEAVFEDMTDESIQPAPETKDSETPAQKPVEEKKEEYPEPKGERFNDQPPWKRIIVLIAGATMNYLLALVLLIVMFTCIGRPLYTVWEKPAENGATEASVQTVEPVLQEGDIILEIGGESLYLITDYMDVLDGKKAGDTVKVKILREGKERTVKLTLQENADFVNMSDTGRLLNALGLDGLYTVTVKQGFFEGIGHSLAYSVKIGGVVLRSLGELVTGKLGMDAVGGPITTISVTAEAASSSVLSFLNIAAFIGVNLAVFNLLPIPALDGCKVIFCVIEWIRRKPVNRKVEAAVHFAGIILLFGFAILVDLLHLF